MEELITCRALGLGSLQSSLTAKPDVCPGTMLLEVIATPPPQNDSVTSAPTVLRIMERLSWQDRQIS